MKNLTPSLRRALVGLLLTAAFPAAVIAQDAAAPPAQTAPAPAPVTIAPPPPAPAPTATVPPPTPAPTPVAPRAANPPAQVPEAAEPPAAERAARRPARTATRARSAPVRRAPAPERATPAPAAPPEPAPEPAPAPPPAVEPVAAAPAPPPVEAVPPPPVAAPASTQAQPAIAQYWPLAAILVLLAGLGFLALRSRRRRRAAAFDQPDYVEPAYVEPAPTEYAPAVAAEPEPPRSFFAAPAAAAAGVAGAAAPHPANDAVTEPAAQPEPAAVAETSEEPVAAPAEEVAVTEPEPDAIAAMAAASEPDAGRPWLEFLMRPIRAGTSDDNAVVEFELTVGNTGSVAANDVRISTWMFAAGSVHESEMERLLIEPPTNAQVSEVSIAPGDGARVEASIALPKATLRDNVLPVVVADARYSLPDGSEGRTSASFAIGMPSEDGLEPFAVNLPSGLHEQIEARLHGELQRT